MKWLRGGLMLLSLILLGLGLRSITGDAGPRADPVPDSRFLGTVVVDAYETRTITLANPSGFPIRIIGSSGTCTAQACLVAEGLPIQISPHGSHTLQILVVALQPGVFSLPLTLYTSGGASPEVSLELSGVGISNTTPDRVAPTR